MLETDVASNSRKIFGFVPWRLSLVLQVSSGKKSYIDAENTETSGIRPLRKGLGLFDNSHGTQQYSKKSEECKFAPPPPTPFTGLVFVNA